jgi:hypothetical protein
MELDKGDTIRISWLKKEVIARMLNHSSIKYPEFYTKGD